MENPIPRGRRRSAVAATAMLILTEAVYMRPEILLGKSSLMGSDYEMLHRLRLAFARQSLFGPAHMLPGWNPHEVLGAPFSANLQGFPLIPTRLVLLFLDPSVAYGVGVAIAAALAALFTFLYCRRAGLSPIGAAAAGWTFACAGFFSSRVMAGHLPLLEAYPALPLLLWLVDRALDKGRRIDFAALALSCTCVVLAGHPQVPVYAVVSAFLYMAWQGRSVDLLSRARVAAAMILGIGLSLAAWWPMLKLIGRSTRILNLAAPDNDVAMPLSRLLALIVPGIQGWADPVDLATGQPFEGYPNSAYFWDTASYMGLGPLFAIAALLIWCLWKKRMPEGRWLFLTLLGASALVFSLRVVSPLMHLLPGTLLRSPARLLYVSTFCAAVALGAGVDALSHFLSRFRPVVAYAALGVILLLHYADLCWFGHWFIQTYPRDEVAASFQNVLDREVGDGRIADERDGNAPVYGEKYDDAGGFDSIFSARFNRGYMALAGLPPDTNEQVFDASVLPPGALEAMGVRFVITSQTRKDLTTASIGEKKLYRVLQPMARAMFFPAELAEIEPEDRIPALYASGNSRRLLLEPGAKPYMPAGSAGGVQTAFEYSRPSSDVIEVRSANRQSGFVYVLEGYDPGWSATVDGLPAPVLPANGFAMAVPMGAGSHRLGLRYATPGRYTGEALSFVSVIFLTILVLRTPSGKRGRSAMG